MKDKVIYEKKEFLSAEIINRATIIAEVGYSKVPKIDASLTLFDSDGEKFCLNIGFSTSAQYMEAMRKLTTIKKVIEELRVKMREADDYLNIKKKEKFGV